MHAAKLKHAPAPVKAAAPLQVYKAPIHQPLASGLHRSPVVQGLSGRITPSTVTDHAALLNRAANHRSSAANKAVLLRLQRQYGNNYVNQVLQQASQRGKETSTPPGIQAKLTIGPAGDKYEREADRVASDVVQRINAPSSPAAGDGPPVQARRASEENLQTKSQITSLQREVMPDADELRAQMKPAAALHRQEPEDEMLKDLQKKPASPDKHDLKEEEEGKHPIQKKSHSDPASHALKEHDEDNLAQLQPFTRNPHGQAISEPTPDLESSIQDARGKGRPLPTHILAPMEQAFGANFSGVKVHTDSHADHLNRAIQARAFTTGQDVFFRQGEFSLGSKRGQELLAHELTHVVQQNGRKTEPKTDSNDSSKDQQLPAPTQSSQIDTSPRPAEPTSSPITDANADWDLLAEPFDAGLQEIEAAHQEPASDAAPQSAETDPGFRDVVRQAKDVATDQQDHPPATIKASEAQAAAIPPSNEVESKAQDKQVDEMVAAPIPPFEPKAFKDALMMRLAEITPKDLKDAENFKNSNKLESVKNDVSSKVETAQQDSKGPLEERSSQLPDTSGIPTKQVSPLLPNPPGDLPSIIGPEQAAPKAKGQSEVEGPAMARSQSLEQQLAAAGITEEQLLKSNEPQFQAALDNKKAAQSHSQNAPQAYRQGEQTDILQAQASAALTSKDKLQGMHGSRSQALAEVTGKQVDGKGKDEQKRTKIADDIDKIYQITKTKVDTKLAQLSTVVITVFDSGAALAKNLFEVYVAQKMEAYKQKRYAEWGPFGWLRWIGDQIMGLPDEVNRFYEDGRNQYIYFMDGVIEEVAIIVATGLNDAIKDVSTGREEIKRYVSSLPDDLKQIGVEAAEGIQSQFDDLQQDIQNHQDEMIGILAQKYKENLDAINTRIKELQEANKGLIQKAIDAIVGVITTIIELGKLLLQVLARVAASIGKILLDPIGFLSNLFNALKQGLFNFVKNIRKYLTQGLLGWLTGALSGANIQFPKSFEDSQGIFAMVTGVLGITYEAIRAKAVRRLGRDGEQKAAYLEQSFEMFRILATQGVVGVWQVIKDRFGDFKSMVLEPITHFITTSVIEAGVVLLIGMMTPATGFIRACKAIYDIIKFVIERAHQIAALVNSILDAVGLVADGAIEQASLKVETTLADAIPMAIGFMASILGLGDISQKVQTLLQKLRRPIDRVIDWVIDQGVKVYKSVGQRRKKSKLGKKIGLAKKRAADNSKIKKKNKARTIADKKQHDAKVNAGLAAIDQEEKKYLKKGKIAHKDAEKVASTVKRRYSVFKVLTVADGGKTWDYNYVASPQKRKQGEEKNIGIWVDFSKDKPGNIVFKEEEQNPSKQLADPLKKGKSVWIEDPKDFVRFKNSGKMHPSKIPKTIGGISRFRGERTDKNLRQWDVGQYSDLKKFKFTARYGTTSLDRDHTPSGQSRKLAFDKGLLPPGQYRDRDDAYQKTLAIAIPSTLHRQKSRTFGWKQRIKDDASGLDRKNLDAENQTAAVEKDISTMLDGLGTDLSFEAVGGYRTLYKRMVSREKYIEKNDKIEQSLRDALRKAK